jgi:hypothetical protein
MFFLGTPLCLGNILEAMVNFRQFFLFSLKYGDFVLFLFQKKTFLEFAAFFFLSPRSILILIKYEGRTCDFTINHKKT